jgi:hypothetical protein
MHIPRTEPWAPTSSTYTFCPAGITGGMREHTVLVPDQVPAELQVRAALPLVCTYPLPQPYVHTVPGMAPGERGERRVKHGGGHTCFDTKHRDSRYAARDATQRARRGMGVLALHPNKKRVGGGVSR